MSKVRNGITNPQLASGPREIFDRRFKVLIAKISKTILCNKYISK